MNMTPFKKPFKGKGALRRKLAEVEAEYESVLSEMQKLATEFQKTFRTPRFITLRPHASSSRSARRLRWRTYLSTTGKQQFVKLFDNGGHEVLRNYPPSAQQVITVYELKRITLNRRSVELFGERQALREYLHGYVLLSDFLSANADVSSQSDV